MSDQGNNGANPRKGGWKKSAKRKTSQRTGFEENPIEDLTKRKQANKDMLLGEIQFNDTSSKKGNVKLEGYLLKHMQSMWTEQKRGGYRTPPYKIDIRSLKLGALNSLSRPDKRKMLRELANERYQKEKVKITGIDGDFSKERTLSLAAVLVLHVGLHKRPEAYDTDEVSTTGKTTIYPDALFAELVGCADADTIKELSHYLRPPLMTLEKLPDFIHCAVRQIARSQKEDRSPEPVALAIQTVSAIAAALEQLKEQIDQKKIDEDKEDMVWRNLFSKLKTSIENDENQKKMHSELEKEKKLKLAKERKEKRLVELKDLLVRTLSKAQSNESVDGETEGEEGARRKEFSRDLGCLAGLLLAGVQRYVRKAQGDAANKKEICDLFIDASAGLLTGIPVGGFIFGPVGSVGKYASHRLHHDDKEGELGQLNRGVRQHFDQFIAAPVFFDGEYVEKAQEEGGENSVIEVDWDEFSKWYDQVISWNEMQNEMIAWEQRKRRQTAF